MEWMYVRSIHGEISGATTDRLAEEGDGTVRLWYDETMKYSIEYIRIYDIGIVKVGGSRLKLR